MFVTARRWFTPPVFEDAEHGRVASLLHLMALTLLSASVITAISASILGHNRAAVALATGTAGPIGALWLIRRGRLKAAGLLILLVFLGVLTFLLYDGDGFHDVVALAYPGAVVMAALLLDRRGFILYVLLTTLALLGIIYGELHGYVVNPLSGFTSPADLIYVSVIIFITAVLAHQLSDNITKSIAKARASQRALAESNLELQRQIAERKRLEEAYRALVDHSLQGLLILQDDRIVFANQALATMSGYSVEELLAMAPKEIARIVPPEGQALVWDHFQDCLYQTDVLDRYECRGLRKDGTVSWVETYASLIDYQGKPAIQMAILDITERKQAEQALRESEERYRTIVENSPDAIALTDERGIMVEWNPGAEQIMGLKRIEVLGRPIWDVQFQMTPRERQTRARHEQLKEMSLHSLKAGRVLNSHRLAETEMQRPDGTRIITQTSIFFIETAEGYRVGSIVRDITEHKQAEEALHRERDLLNRIMETSPVGITVLDRQGKTIFANAYADQTLGLNRDKTLQLPVTTPGWRIIDYGGNPFPEEELAHRQVLRTGQPVHDVRHAIEWQDGQRRLLSVNAAPLFDESGRVDGIVTTVEDITQRLQAEKELEQLLAQIQEQARQMKQIVDTVPEGVLLLNIDGQIILANPVAEEKLATLAGANVGDTLSHLGNRPLTEFLIAPPKGLWHEVTADGRSFQVIARPIETGPTPGGWVLVIHDVTQQREIQRRIQEQERLAAVGQLAAGIAHDFNNIMATIVLYAQMAARSEGLSAPDRERLATINQQAQHATALIQQILDFSRRAALERQPMDLLAFLKEQIRLLERILPENIEIDLVYDRGDYTVHADPTRIQQAIMNLAVNARDAMPDGGELRVELERVRFEESEQAPLPEIAAGEWIRLRLADTGTGIPADVLPHVFEPFFTTKPVGEGTGLGLAQVWGIVKQHEGHVDVITALGEGTAFTLYLPTLKALRQDSPKQGRSCLAQGQGQTILVAEDSASLRETLAQALGMLNYRVLMATNGQRALATFEQHAEQISLVLTDMVMPGMGGVALSHALREKGWAGPIIMVTGHPLYEKERKPRLQGVVKWLQKPVNLEQLAQMVAQVLNS